MKKYIFLIPMIAFFLTSCSKEVDKISSTPKLTLTLSPPPFSVPAGTKFSADVSFNQFPNSTFDIFMPSSGKPTALAIFIHGGGFVGGDKSSIYSQGQDDIKSYLDHSIAFATINYRFKNENPDSSILISLADIKRCIQFIRYHASSFNIDKEKIACYGGSAGGGASIYLAFHPDMADPGNIDPIMKESTRIIAAGHLTSQCTYDPIRMEAMYAESGIDLFAIPGIEQSVLADFRADSISQFYIDPRLVALRHELEMLGWMTPDDPEFFVSNENPAASPSDRRTALHHPLQGKALDNKATEIGLAHVTHIPSLNLLAPNHETISQFMIRKLSE